MKTTRKERSTRSRARYPYGRCTWCGGANGAAHLKVERRRYCCADCLKDDVAYDAAQEQSRQDRNLKFIAGFFSNLFGQGKPIQTAIPQDMFRKLLFLCHPDKHSNHAWATEVTQWLLEERKKGV